MIELPGRYRGPVVDSGLGKSKNGYAEIQLLHELTERWNPETETWETIATERMASYNYIEGAKGVNEGAVANLENVFGWNASGPNAIAFWNGNANLPGCQIDCDWNTYNGETKMRINWINGFDDTPRAGVKKATPDVVRELQNRLGSKLRAITTGGGASNPNASATPPASKPTMPENAVAKEQAWIAFVDYARLGNPDVTRDQCIDQWTNDVLENYGDNWKAIYDAMTGAAQDAQNDGKTDDLPF